MDVGDLIIYYVAACKRLCAFVFSIGCSIAHYSQLHQLADSDSLKVFRLNTRYKVCISDPT